MKTGCHGLTLRRRVQMTLVAPLLVVAIATIAPAQGYPYVVTDLGVVGSGTPIAWGINETGDTTVGWFSWPVNGWVHTAAGMAALPTLPGFPYGSARDVNDAGQIVGSSWPATINQPGHAYRITPGVGIVDLGTLGGATSEAWRINNAGQVVGDSAASDGNNHAFLYTDGTGMVNLAPQTAYSNGRGISQDGKATGSMTVGNVWRAFRYIPGVGSSDIGVPSGYGHSYGYAINDLGQVAGTVSTASGTFSALFRWTPGSGFVVFGSSGSQTSAWAINASGTVVGRSPVGGVYRAVMYADGLGMVDLNTLIDPASGWTLLHATDINDAGQIVGHGHFGPMGETRSFRLDPVGSASVVVLGTGCAGGAPPALSSTVPHLGQALTLSVAQALTGSNGALVVSGVPLAPTPLGANCVAYIDLGTFVELSSIAIDGNGSWSLSLVLPNAPSLSGAQLALQAALLDMAGPFGLDITNGLHLTLGY